MDDQQWKVIFDKGHEMYDRGKADGIRESNESIDDAYKKGFEDGLAFYREHVIDMLRTVKNKGLEFKLSNRRSIR